MTQSFDITIFAFPYKQCHHQCEFLKNFHCTNLEPCKPTEECSTCLHGLYDLIGYTCDVPELSAGTSNEDTTPTSLTFECAHWYPKNACNNCCGWKWCKDRRYMTYKDCVKFQRMTVVESIMEMGIIQPKPVFPNDESSVQYFLHDLTAAIIQLTGKIHVADNLIEGITHIDGKVATIDNALDIIAMGLKTHYLKEHEIDISSIRPPTSEYRPVHPRFCKKCDGRDVVNISGGYKCKDCGNSWDIETKKATHDDCFGLVSELGNRCKFIEEHEDSGLFSCMVSPLAEVELPELCFGYGDRPPACDKIVALDENQKLDSDKAVETPKREFGDTIVKVATQIEKDETESKVERVYPPCEICGSTSAGNNEKIMSLTGFKWACQDCKKKTYTKAMDNKALLECPKCQSNDFHIGYDPVFNPPEVAICESCNASVPMPTCVNCYKSDSCDNEILRSEGVACDEWKSERGLN